jgi:hypothetical protein
MWHYELLTALRTGQTMVIDFNVPNSNCLITFPSGHTILAIIMTYALRGSRWTLIPACIINGGDAGVHDSTWRASFVRLDRRRCDCGMRHRVRPASTGCPASSFGDQHTAMAS